MSNTKFTRGPWFIWKEAALKAEGFSGQDLHFEMLERGYHDIMAGVPLKLTRSVVSGCKQIISLDTDDFDCDDDDEAAETVLANAHLIAAAPDLYKALEILCASSRLRSLISDDEINPESPVGLAITALAKARGEG